ncbi:MAG: lipid-A-disaccharide synthase [Bacteroidaceae bacterium]|nr:lipid-A-disaccharide synthase [Bacteroidaceae bacterium]
MKYFLIVGEASGDLHASNLMRALRQNDASAEFRYFGGDKMQAVGGTLLSHYKDIAYMGFLNVFVHLPAIFKAMRRCREAIVEWQPDVLILVDYPGFNLKIAKYIKRHTRIPIYYYISPKIWAWKEWRIKAIKRDVDEMFSILPFEVPFYRRHDYPIHYVGNPTVDEIAEWRRARSKNGRSAGEKDGRRESSPTIALLPGSRRKEITDNLPIMLEAAVPYAKKGYRIVIAGAPSISDELYEKIIGKRSRESVVSEDAQFTICRDQSFSILAQSEAALVTSGTATLETALMRVPQVVCYYLGASWVFVILRKLLLKVKYISLVNLIVDRELVPELVGSEMNVAALSEHLAAIVRGGAGRDRQLQGYEEMTHLLGEPGAPARAAHIIYSLLQAK